MKLNLLPDFKSITNQPTDVLDQGDNVDPQYKKIYSRFVRIGYQAFANPVINKKTNEWCEIVIIRRTYNKSFYHTRKVTCWYDPIEN